MEIDNIKNLAEKARIEISEDEINDLAIDFDKILEYISQINESGVEINQNKDLVLKNVYREDEAVKENRDFRTSIIKEMPESKDDYLKVKKIL